MLELAQRGHLAFPQQYSSTAHEVYGNHQMPISYQERFDYPPYGRSAHAVPAPDYQPRYRQEYRPSPIQTHEPWLASPLATGGSSSFAGSSMSAASDNAIPQPRPKRAQVRNACTNCQKACKRCSSARPCERCSKYGLDDCVDSPRKPRAKGFKRGPYKKRAQTSSSAHRVVGSRKTSFTTPASASPASSGLESIMPELPPPNPFSYHQRMPPAFAFELDQLPALTPLRSSTPTPQAPPTGFNGSNLQLAQEVPQHQSQDLAAHAQLLRDSLANAAGMASCPTSPRMRPQLFGRNTALPFMGHAASAPTSPSGLRVFMELEDM